MIKGYREGFSPPSCPVVTTRPNNNPVSWSESSLLHEAIRTPSPHPTPTQPERAALHEAIKKGYFDAYNAETDLVGGWLLPSPV